MTDHGDRFAQIVGNSNGPLSGYARGELRAMALTADPELKSAIAYMLDDEAEPDASSNTDRFTAGVERAREDTQTYPILDAQLKEMDA